MVGLVVAVDDEGGDDLKSVLLAPDPEPLFPASLLELGSWISRYYTTPIGLTFRAMLPSALWGSSRLVAEVRDKSSIAGGASRDVMLALTRAGGRASATTLARKLRRPVWETLQRLARTGAVALETEPPSLGPTAGFERVLVLTSVVPSLIERDRVFGRAERQRAAYEAADALGGEVGIKHLTDQLGFSRAVLNGLVDRGLARFEARKKLRDPFGDVVGSTPPRLTSEQTAATNAIRGLPPSHCATLFGVTGSGKTLVYLEAFREEVERGRGIIVLVPEISLTPQTVARVRGVFGDRVAVLHSGLSDAERADAWRSLASGQRRVAVGARSAVSAPVQNLAAIILDEEHDSSYKHGESPRYHARDVALKRASLENSRVVLVGATPSLETWAAEYRGTRVSLPNRIGAKPLPEVTLVDMRSEPRVSESGKVPWSHALDDAVTSELGGGNQIILLLNRRGFAHFLQCETCGKVWDCPNCSISLTVHRTPSRLRCHYCGYEDVVPLTCSDCSSTTQRASGTGTQLLEQWLAERYPAARLARMDADTTTAKWSHQKILDAVAERQVDVLFGTQMIAKGLDFPGVTLVGVVDADTGLHLPDFRAAERTFQLISQVAGRAGRGPKGGRVLVQTRTPNHYALTAAAQHDYEGFAACELSARQSPPYPPHVGLVNVVVSALRETDAVRAASDVADWLRGLVATRAEGAVDVIGPAPAPLARIKRRWRWHILYRAVDRTLLDRVTRYAAHRAPHANSHRVRVVFDRDPVSVL
jgi:primosomal protein N' (replication factor Y)